MKGLFIGLLFIAIIVIGVVIYFKYLFRIQVFEDMVYITKYFKNNISFSKDDFDTLLNNCFSDLHKSTKNILNKNNSILNNSDNSLINNYFLSLGHGDVCYEIKNLEYYESLFLERLAFHKENKKLGSLYFKLLIGLGVLVVIILI